MSAEPTAQPDVVVTELAVPSDQVPGPVACTLVHPAGLDPAGPGGPVPLVLALHGGAGNAEFTEMMVEQFGAAWSGGAVPPCVVVLPESGRSFWVDHADGSANWEAFLWAELPDAARAAVPACASGPVALLGVSMGGLGVLRLAFRHPEAYVAVAALEPAVEDAMTWDEVEPASNPVRSLELFESLHGSPVDPAHFARNHPPALIVERADAIAASDLQLYLECGDLDVLDLYRGAERMHRLLFDRGILHEYHLVRGADHIGDTLGPRFAEAIAFLGRVLDPPPPDALATAFRQLLGR